MPKREIQSKEGGGRKNLRKGKGYTMKLQERKEKKTPTTQKDDSNLIRKSYACP